jgi:hypothetical protein
LIGWCLTSRGQYFRNRCYKNKTTNNNSVWRWYSDRSTETHVLLGFTSKLRDDDMVTRVTRRVPLMEQELLTFPNHRSSPPVFSRVRVTRSLILYEMFCRSLFVLLSNLRILITDLVSSNSSYKHLPCNGLLKTVHCEQLYVDKFERRDDCLKIHDWVRRLCQWRCKRSEYKLQTRACRLSCGKFKTAKLKSLKSSLLLLSTGIGNCINMMRNTL